RRLLASAPEVHFSYSRQSDGPDSTGVAVRPSRLVAQIAGPFQPLSIDLIAAPLSPPATVFFDDASRIPFPAGAITGGSSVLTAQSQCPFKAFATARLVAKSWEPAEAGLTAPERGLLLHEVLHSVWAGPPRGIRSHKELLDVPDLGSFVSDHVRHVFATQLPSRARDSMPARYLDLEQTRLVSLVVEWLRYESKRVPFTVAETELDTSASLIDNSLLVIDYKSGDIKPGVWDLPRPDDVQLPLYAEFGLDSNPGSVGGLVFAKVRPGDTEFAGKVRNAKATLRANLKGNTSLVKKPLVSEQLSEWRDYIQDLALDFLSGSAVVDPRDYPETCERCGLQALCRIQKNPPQSDDDNVEEAGDA
ncbi:MAG: PD-(D/E)XK nuclease family protein, partial [Terracidiphilus sp.]